MWVIKGKTGEVSSIGHLHYFQKGRSYVMEDKLIYCEPGKKYVSQVSGDVLTAQVETTLHSSGNETEMNVTWSGKGKIFFLKLLLPLLRGKLIKQSKSELETFKKLVEIKELILVTGQKTASNSGYEVSLPRSKGQREKGNGKK